MEEVRGPYIKVSFVANSQFAKYRETVGCNTVYRGPFGAMAVVESMDTSTSEEVIKSRVEISGKIAISGKAAPSSSSGASSNNNNDFDEGFFDKPASVISPGSRTSSPLNTESSIDDDEDEAVARREVIEATT